MAPGGVAFGGVSMMSVFAAMVLQPLRGAAHALIFGIFLVAAAGKLAACGPGTRVMCRKGGVDAALALGASLFMLPGVAPAVAVAAMAIGGGGWLRERIRRNTVCNCFGVLTATLHPLRNVSRAILFGSGVLAIVLAWQSAPDTSALWMGAASALAILLGGTALVFARQSLPRKPAIHVSEIVQVTTLAPGTISPATVVGTDKVGQALALRDLARPGVPLAMLLTSPDCKACHAVKAAVDPLMASLPFPMFSVISAAPSAALPAASVFDPEGQWRKTLGVRMLPSLVIVDGDAGNLACPVASGTEAILAQLLALAVRPQQRKAGAPAMTECLPVL
jgi:hypothetical protein